MPWINDFRNRFDRFEKIMPPHKGEIPISIKVRIDTGCYSRGCCPYAFRQIDHKVNQLSRTNTRFVFEEHETGPELLVYLAVTTAGITLAKSLIDLVITIIKARSEGSRHGDRHDDPVTLVVRRLESDEIVAEERILTFHKHDEVSRRVVEKALRDGCEKIVTKKNKKSIKRSSVRRTRSR